MAFELGKKDWKLALTSGFGVAPWLQTVASGDWAAVARALQRGRARFGLAPAAGVQSCYEAGRDGSGFTARSRNAGSAIAWWTRPVSR